MKNLRDFNSKKIIKIFKAKSDAIAILPTETVFGFFAIANSENRKKLLKIKETKDLEKPLSIMFATIDEVIEKFDLTNEKQEIVLSNLPSKKTLILKVKERAFPQLSGITEMGVRVVDNDLIELKKVLKEIGPMFTTSVNKDGQDPIPTSKQIKQVFENEIKNKEIDLIVKKNSYLSHKATMIVDLTKEIPKIVREG